MRKLKDTPSLSTSIDDALSKQLEDAPSIGVSEKGPSVSVGSKQQPKDVVMVTFLETQPAPKEVPDKIHAGKFKTFQWVKVELKSDHEGYQDGAKVALKKGDTASMNLARHANLKKWAEGIGDLNGRTFIIGTMAMVETAKGNNCMDYRIKEVDAEE